MNINRFNQLLNGPLSHPLPVFTIMRLQLALRHVVEATGPVGEAALEAACRAREAQDNSTDEYPNPATRW